MGNEEFVVTSNFSFSYIVFKRLVRQSYKIQGLCGKELPITTQSLLLTPLRKKPLENIVGKRGKMLVTSIFSFPTMFSTLHKTNFKFSVIFILSSANAFNLGKPKILSFGNGLKIILLFYFQSLFPTRRHTETSAQCLVNGNTVCVDVLTTSLYASSVTSSHATSSAKMRKQSEIVVYSAALAS